MDAIKRTALLKAVADLKAKGVTGIKVELEANMDRRYTDDGWDEQNCFDWLMNYIAAGTNSSLPDIALCEEYKNPFPWMSYACFYDDGSVDSELTFTIKLNNPENIFHLPIVVEGFKELSEQIGQGFETGGAGMHMALLFNRSCTYPSTTNLPVILRRNMKRSVTQLLPALYFLAATNENTRPVSEYRIPRISMEYSADSGVYSSPKYSAISYRDGAMEFRVFDTCYDIPDRILDNIAVMANCMRYATETYKSPNLAKIATRIQFGNDSSHELARLYSKETHLDLLNAGLKLIKPSYLTIKEVKAQRKFNRTKTHLRNMDKHNAKQARLEYKEYQERTRWREYSHRLEVQASLIQTRARETSQLQSATPEEATILIEPQVEAQMESWRRNYITDVADYVADRVRRMSQANINDNYELLFR